jgi:hypothetical protein
MKILGESFNLEDVKPADINFLEVFHELHFEERKMI